MTWLDVACVATTQLDKANVTNLWLFSGLTVMQLVY